METLDQKNYKKIIYSLTWFSFFFCINLNPIEFGEFNLINKLRILAPLILLIFSILIFKKVNYKNLLEIDTIFFLFIFLLYFIFNIINVDNNLANLFWPVYMFLAVFFLTTITNSDERRSLMKLSIYILFIAFIFYFSLAIIDMIKHKNMNFYGILGSNDSYSGIKNPPRSSGLARISLMLFAYFLLYFLIKRSNHKNDYKLLLLICFFATCTNLFQSRTVSFIFIGINLALIIFYFKKIILNKKILLFSLLIPLIINSSYNYLKYKYSYTNFYKEDLKTSDSKMEIIGHIAKNSILRDQNPDSLNSYSSGRFENWKKAYDLIISKPLIGYGAQSDRIYFKQSIHNAYLYTLLSGSILAGIFLLLINLRTLYFFIKYIKIKILKTDFISSLSLLLIIIITQRSILETSLAIFSIDFLIFILSYMILKNKTSKNI